MRVLDERLPERADEALVCLPFLQHTVRVYRARTVLPVSAPPIENGAVAVEGGRITAVGAWSDLPGGEAVDLGEVILMPGLINSHCHLDYSSLRGAILYTGSFSLWVRRLNEIKRSLDDDDYLEAIAEGFRELRRWGTTSVYNIESFPELMVRMPPPPLRTWWFYELLDIRSRIHTEEVVAGALAFFEERPKWLGGYGLSPHAPYTTSLSLYELTRICCEKYGMPLMTHLAETMEEYEMFANASGKLYNFLSGLGRNMSDTGSRTPVAHLIENGALPHGAILTHMNVLAESDWELLAAHKDDYSIAHCPNCHVYFEREPFDLPRFLSLGINLCLGTDSLASSRALNLFEEMRIVRNLHPELPVQQILHMVTLNAARAIGLPGLLGEIRPGAYADLIAIPDTGKAEGVYDRVIANRAPIEWCLVEGREVSL